MVGKWSTPYAGYQYYMTDDRSVFGSVHDDLLYADSSIFSWVTYKWTPTKRFRMSELGDDYLEQAKKYIEEKMKEN